MLHQAGPAVYAGEISAIVKTIRCETYDDPVPLDLMKGGSLFNNMPFTLETALLLSEAAFNHSETGQDLALNSQRCLNLEHGIKLTYDVILFKFFGINNAGSTMPNENIHTLCMRIDLIAPLHNCNSRSRRWLPSRTDT